MKQEDMFCEKKKKKIWTNLTLENQTPKLKFDPKLTDIL